MTDQCGNCRFWRTHGEEREVGDCVRFPPQLSDHALRFYAENPGEGEDGLGEARMLRAVRGLNVWYHPVTHCSDICGEFRPADHASDTGAVGDKQNP